MSLRCFCCDDWTENILKVNAPFYLLAARNPQSTARYDGKQFTHCPWYGNPLKDTPPTHPAQP